MANEIQVSRTALAKRLHLTIPEVDEVKCQEQLQLMSYAVHDLVMGAIHLHDGQLRQSCLDAVQSLLRTFFLNEDTR